MRRMSPLEVWRPGSRALKPIRPHVAAMIVGTEGGEPRPVRNGEIEVTSCEIQRRSAPLRRSSAPAARQLISAF
jgi:hypothetical protein